MEVSNYKLFKKIPLLRGVVPMKSAAGCVKKMVVMDSCLTQRVPRRNDKLGTIKNKSGLRPDLIRMESNPH